MEDAAAPPAPAPAPAPAAAPAAAAQAPATAGSASRGKGLAKRVEFLESEIEVLRLQMNALLAWKATEEASSEARAAAEETDA